MTKILIVGCGKIGRPLARQLAQDGHSVTGLRRSVVTEEEPFEWLALDVCDPSAVATLPNDFDQVIIILTPAGRSPEGYAQIYQHGLDLLLARLGEAEKKPDCIFVSATSVYGQQDGAWLDESSETAPETYNGQSLLAAENAILAFGANSIVVRFSGIYGAERSRVLDKLKQPLEVQRTPPHFTNRIHQTDCINVLNHLAALQRLGENKYSLYLATDHDCAPMFEMMTWLADQAGLTAPMPVDAEANAKQNKRCRNLRLIESGYRFKYDSYREGYGAMFAR